MPAEVKVLGWRKGERKRHGRKGCWRPWARGRRRHRCGPAVRVPWGAKAEYAFRAGYDGMGRVSLDSRGREGLFRHADTVHACDSSCVKGRGLIGRMRPACQPG